MTTETQTPQGEQGLDPNFATAIQRMIAASGGRLHIVSGYRSDQEQAQLFQQAVQKYGSVQAARNWVAPPGDSNHNRGMAVDLGGDIALAHQLAPQFGLVFPMSWEPWHIEPVGARETAKPSAYTTAPQGQANPTDPSTWNDLPSVLAMTSNALANPVAPGTPTGDVLAGDVPGAATSSPTSSATAMGGSAGGGGTTDSGAPQVFGPGSLQSNSDRQQWAVDFLTALGKPVTADNITALVAWQQAESGGGGGRFNPLNTTQGGYQGETDLNSVGVKNYTNYNDGIAANVKVINNGRYQNILDALTAGNNAEQVARAVAASPWGTGNGVLNVLGQNPTLIQPPAPPKPQVFKPNAPVQTRQAPRNRVS